MIKNRNYVIGDSIQDAWYDLLFNLVHDSERHVAPRGMGTRETLGMRLEVRNMTRNIIDHPVRNLNYKFMVAEALWILFGLDSTPIIAQYNSRIKQFSDDGLVMTGAYGPRLKEQWDYVVKCLSDRDTRQAVATTWRPNPPRSKDIPCTLTFQFLIREDSKGYPLLHLIVNMRSSDAWLGIPYDVYSFTFLANCLAWDLGVRPGRFIMNLGSSHLYDKDYEAALEVLKDTVTHQGIASPVLPGRPPDYMEAVLRTPYSFKLIKNEEAYPDFRNPWRYYVRALAADNWTQAKEALSDAALSEL